MADREEQSLGKKAARAAKWSIVTQIVSKLISPVTTMVLARLLSPEAFGIVATATMVTSLAEMMSDAGFQKYLIQRDFSNREEMSLSACVAFWTNLAIAIGMVVLITVFNNQLAAAVGNPGLGIVLVVASASLPLTSLVSVQTALYQREFDFKTLFASGAGSSLLILVVSVALALIGFDYWSMIAGTIASKTLLAVWLTAKSRWKPQFNYSFAELKQMFSFGGWVLVESFATWVNTWAGTFILGALMTSYYVGMYKTSTNICASVTGVFTAAILPIAFAALSRVQEDETRFEAILLKMQRYLAICVIPVSVLSLAYSKVLTFILLGDQWGETQLFVGLWMFTGCVNIVFGYMCSEAYRAKGKPHLCVLVQVLYLLPILPALYISASFGYGCVSVIMPALRIVLVMINLTVAKLALGLSPLKMLANVGPSFIQSLIAATPGIAALTFTDSLHIEIVAAFLSLALYLLMLFSWKSTRETSLDLLKRLGLSKAH